MPMELVMTLPLSWASAAGPGTMKAAIIRIRPNRSVVTEISFFAASIGRSSRAVIGNQPPGPVAHDECRGQPGDDGAGTAAAALHVQNVKRSSQQQDRQDDQGRHEPAAVFFDPGRRGGPC